MDGQDGQHVEVRWAKLGPRRKSGWEPLSGSHRPKKCSFMRFAGHLSAMCEALAIGQRLADKRHRTILSGI